MGRMKSTRDAGVSMTGVEHQDKHAIGRLGDRLAACAGPETEPRHGGARVRDEGNLDEHERERAIGLLVDRHRSRTAAKLDPADVDADTGRQQQAGPRDDRRKARLVGRPRPFSGLHGVIQIQVRMRSEK